MSFPQETNIIRLSDGHRMAETIAAAAFLVSTLLPLLTVFLPAAIT